MSLLESAAIVKVDKAVAQDALREYRKHRAAATPEDQAIMAAYREIARGRIIVQAIESIRAAGWNVDGSTKLAITRADVRRCEGSFSDTQVEFSAAGSRGCRARIRVAGMPQRPPVRGNWVFTATVPLIPLHLRPKASLTNYHILWEADWVRAPADPLLLRRLKGDLWIVLAAWELSAVERAVLEQRVNS